MVLPPNVFVFDTPEQLAVAAVERFVECARLADDRLEHFSVVLAGGNTPRRVYELLATDPFRQRVQWSRIDLFSGMNVVCRQLMPTATTAWLSQH